ncbi:hypothetical protein HS125_17865 [bacterium]|nr:hypothetical protein [bacterium]
MNRRARGFMLAEVLIAMTILATGVTVLLMSIINSVNLSRDTRDRSTAVFLAERIMWRLEEATDLADNKDVPDREAGDFELPQFSRFRWESEKKENRKTASYELRVTVYWVRSDRDKAEKSLSLYSQSMMPRVTVGRK